MSTKVRYLLHVWEDVEPRIVGPFLSEEERDRKARHIREFDDGQGGIFPLDIPGCAMDCMPEVSTYSGAFFEEPTFRMHYQHCASKWTMDWSCACNDKCPECGAEIAPYKTEDI